MRYHAELWLGESQPHRVLNKTKQEIVETVLLPFVRGQVTWLKIDGLKGLQDGKTLLNMNCVSSVMAYRTESIMEAIKFIDADSRVVPEECTDELLEEARTMIANPGERLKSIFQLAFAEPRNQLFIIMKFGDKMLDSAYQGVICPIAEEFELNPIRIDDIQNSGKIDDQILQHIAESKIVLADLSGERPNCYYETGFAQALGKEIILTIRKDETKHFDLATYRFIEWETENELREKLKLKFESITGKLSK